MHPLHGYNQVMSEVKENHAPQADYGLFTPQLIGVSLSEKHVALFERYLIELLDWNAKFNLTAIREPNDIRLKHFLDSLTVIRASGDLSGKKLVDVGTGAGFPGIPLKIIFPTMKLTLMDAVGKKLKFCEHVCKTLGLDNVTLHHVRAEDAGKNENLRENFDFAAARAVTQLPALSEYLLPLVKVGGCMIAQKSAASDHEIAEAENALSQLGGTFESRIPVRLPIPAETDAADRALFVIRKTAPTPPTYPRQAGTPTRSPL